MVFLTHIHSHHVGYPYFSFLLAYLLAHAYNEISNQEGKHMNYVYILTNFTHTVLYIGVTSNLPRRLYEHKHELVDGFTKTYHVHELMYAEPHSDIRTAIAREKQLKKWGRKKKNELISKANPYWLDLSADWLP